MIHYFVLKDVHYYITIFFVFCPGMTIQDFHRGAFERGKFALYSSRLKLIRKLQVTASYAVKVGHR